MMPGWVERVLVGILLVIAAGIVVHAPLTVWLETTWSLPEQYVKAWKEILMGGALVLLLVVAARRKQITSLLKDRLIQLCLVYAGVHFAMVGVFGWQAGSNLPAVGAGLLIDLRFVLYFALVYGALRLVPSYKPLFICVFVGGAAVVLGFALLQLFVLPKDILAHIGYSKATIAPYLTVDENQDYIRINSTLRGPNPLGAYVAIVAGLLAAAALRWKLTRRHLAVMTLVAVAAVMTLGASHSRSAFIGTFLAVAAAVIVAIPAKLRKQVSLAVAAIAIIAAVSVVALRDTPFVANVVFHDNPTTGAEVDSNKGHIDSLEDGVVRMVKQPLGAGIGSTGSASLEGDQPVIIENYYLFVAHEAGWFGLVVFVMLFVEVMRRLWLARHHVLALGIFSSGIGLAVIGMLLPVWADDTVSIVWWGLAAVAIGGAKMGSDKKKLGGKKRGA